VLTADGVVSLIGCLMGNPSSTAVYIGPSRWKAMGGRTLFGRDRKSCGPAVVVGIISVLLALVPVVAISRSCFTSACWSARRRPDHAGEACAGDRARFDAHIAAWAKLQIDTMLGSTINAAPRRWAPWHRIGGGGEDRRRLPRCLTRRALPWAGSDGRRFDLTGLVLGAIGVFVIERDSSRRRPLHCPARS